LIASERLQTIAFKPKAPARFLAPFRNQLAMITSFARPSTTAASHNELSGEP